MEETKIEERKAEEREQTSCTTEQHTVVAEEGEENEEAEIHSACDG